MATKTDFSTTEWDALRNAPHLAALAVAAAGASGLGTFKESFAAMEGVMSAQKSDNALLRELSSREEAMAGQQYLRGQVSLGMNPQALVDKIKGLATEQLGVALHALKAKSPADAQAYGDWVAGIATKVSEAATEGGFLGFGGERVSAAETAMIDALKSAMKVG
jgi:hypothetical protein